MTKNRTVMPLLLLLLSGILPHIADAAEESPPSTAAICQTLERLWVDRKFIEVKEHVHELERLWEGYVPVELTLAAYSRRYGSQIEDAIDRLTRLRDRLNADITAASPIFMDVLDSLIVRHQHTLKFYLQRGMSRDQRLATINAVTKTKFTFSPHWVSAEDLMYLNAPEVFVTEKGIVPAHPKEMTDAIPDLKKMDAGQLLQYLDDDEIAMGILRTVVKELVRRRAVGGASEVARGLNEAVTGYTYRDTVDELVRLERDAVPSVLEVLDGATHIEKRCAIWALVRIGAADPEVIQALQKVAKGGRADDAKYARDALQYLQAKHQ